MSPHRTPPPPAPRAPSRRAPRTAGLAVCLVAAGALAVPGAPPAAAADSPGSGTSARATLGKLRELYRQEDRAARAYEGTRRRLAVRQKAYDRLVRGLSDREAGVRTAREAIGTLARERYRAGQVSPYARLLLSDDPATALSQLRVLGRAQAAQAAAIRRLRGGEATLNRGRTAAEKALKTVRDLSARAAAEHDRVRNDLAAVERAIAAR